MGRPEGGLKKLLARLLRLVRTGLEATAAQWPPIQAAYAFVHRAAHLLANHPRWDATTLQQAYQDLLAELRTAQARLGPLADAAAHFRTVTASYWPGLFHCYDVPALPRTNNDLEQYFGAARHLERRATSNGARPGARAPHRRWSCAGPCAWWPPWRRRSSRSTPPRCNRETCMPGRRCASGWRRGTRPGGHRCASAVTRRPTWRR